MNIPMVDEFTREVNQMKVVKCKTCGLKYESGSGLCACDPKWTLNAGDKQSIRHHMGWVHVGTSNMTVARDLLTRAKKYPSKQVRFACTRYALKCHGDNIDTYRKAMRQMLPKCFLSWTAMVRISAVVTSVGRCSTLERLTKRGTMSLYCVNLTQIGR